MPPVSTESRTFTARSRTACGCAASQSPEQSSAAAAPSPTGAHMDRVSGHDTSRSASASSGETSKRYCALGFMEPCQWFLDAASAIWRRVVPQRFMCQAACMA